ncbi:MAG TPA: glycosyltransferase [Burkholderiales bacterium]|nr:glycosyltransferase [Burkholderiales bacterium]
MGRRILIAWELGANLGHLLPLIALARALRSRGHRVLFAMRDLTDAARVAREGFAFLPAPASAHRGQSRAYASYAAMLAGELFPTTGSTLVAALAWRSIMQAARAEVLIADHAPAALLAARALSLRSALYGAPFSTPVAGAPLPAFANASAREVEARLLQRLNAVLDVLRASPFARVSDLYRAETTLVRGVPEIDCFGPRPAQMYVTEPSADAGETIPAWPRADGPKALVYLRAGRYVKPVIEALTAANASTIAYLGGPPKRPAARERRGLMVSPMPYKASALMPQADFVVCNGNAGTVTQAVLAGKPLLMLPTHVEQALNAARVAQTGAGVVPEGKLTGLAMARCLDALQSAGASASRLAARYAGRTDDAAKRLEGMLA